MPRVITKCTYYRDQSNEHHKPEKDAPHDSSSGRFTPRMQPHIRAWRCQARATDVIPYPYRLTRLPDRGPFTRYSQPTTNGLSRTRVRIVRGTRGLLQWRAIGTHPPASRPLGRRDRINLSAKAKAALPSMEDLRVPKEILGAAEALVSGVDAPGVVRQMLEVALRLIAVWDRLAVQSPAASVGF